MPDQAVIRSVGGFFAEVTVKEQHRDEMAITDHPVEKGASITDHAFKLPAQLTLQVGWSAAYSAAVNSESLRDLYADLLDLQASAQPIEVQTGKRLYENMLIRSIATDTDQATEYVLMLSISLREIILVETLQTTMPAAANRATPQSTAGVADTGTKSVTTYAGAVPAN